MVVYISPQLVTYKEAVINIRNHLIIKTGIAAGIQGTLVYFRLPSIVTRAAFSNSSHKMLLKTQQRCSWSVGGGFLPYL